MNVDTVTWQNRLDWRAPILRFSPLQWFGWLLAFTLALWAVLAQGEEFRYRYVSLADKAPPGYAYFVPSALNNRGTVSGTVYNCDDYGCSDFHVAVYERGKVTVLQAGYGGPINSRGTIGGTVDVDPVNYTTQSALFTKKGVELIPPQPGEFTSFLQRLNDPQIAWITSYDIDFNGTDLLYKNGKSTVLDFGLTLTSASGFGISGMNNETIMSGTMQFFNPGQVTKNRAFRFDPRTGKTTVFEPVENDNQTWGLDINNDGDILGYSFRFSGIERIGVWDRDGKFNVYFVEGTPEFPTLSNALVFNDNNLIVISRVRRPAAEADNSYLVPRPGVRLNLADLVENLPQGVKLYEVTAINNAGNILGVANTSAPFLLERIGATDSPSVAVRQAPQKEWSSAAKATAARLRQYMRPTHALKSSPALP